MRCEYNLAQLTRILSTISIDDDRIIELLIAATNTNLVKPIGRLLATIAMNDSTRFSHFWSMASSTIRSTTLRSMCKQMAASYCAEILQLVIDEMSKCTDQLTFDSVCG